MHADARPETGCRSLNQRDQFMSQMYLLHIVYQTLLADR